MCLATERLRLLAATRRRFPPAPLDTRRGGRGYRRLTGVTRKYI